MLRRLMIGLKKPYIDFNINAKGTLNLLELTRIFSPNAPLSSCLRIKFMETILIFYL